MDIYREIILDHYRSPRNYGNLKCPTSYAEEENSSCGDRIRIEIHVKNVSGEKILKDIRFNGDGCAISQAASSLLTEHVVGKNLETIMRITSDDIMTMLHTTLTPTRIKCALLSLEVLHKAIGKINMI